MTFLQRLICIFCFLTSSSFLSAQDELFIRVYPHIINLDDGTGGISDAQLEESKGFLNTAFNPHGIYFLYECTNYINESDFIDGPHPFLCTELEPYIHEDGIDMFIGRDDMFGGGESSGIPGTSFGISGHSTEVCMDTIVTTNTNPNNVKQIVLSRSHVISHEMGHALGLIHTFEEKQLIPYGGCTELWSGMCIELVNRTNCDTCGDYVCDTPAEPFGAKYDKCTCEYEGPVSDPNGDLYNPLATNIMSYSPPACRTSFTLGQAARIRSVIHNSPVLVKHGQLRRKCLDGFCCDSKNVCIKNEGCNSNWSDHCVGCSVEWISPGTGGTNDCVPRSTDPKFVYKVAITQVINGIAYTKVKSFTIDDCYSIQGEYRLVLKEEDLKALIYPNPVSSYFHVNNPMEYALDYSIYSMTGKLQLNSKVAQQSVSNFEIRNTLFPGSYIIKLENTNQGYFQVEKFHVVTY